MNWMKKRIAALLAVVMVLSLAACGQDTQQEQQEEQPEVTPASYSIAALKGPTAMGLVKLMSDAESGAELAND